MKWMRIPSRELPGCQVYASPGSYVTLEADERNARWRQDVELHAPVVLPWLHALGSREL